ncbi:MAG: hypothetical protein V3U57_01820 [Robiginitomaculum sp.]
MSYKESQEPIAKAKVENINFKDIKFEGKNNAAHEISRPVRARESAQVGEINALKQDLSKMADALRWSMRLSKNSVDEIDKLSRFLKTAEVNAMSIDRLQPENVSLKSKLERVRSDLAKKILWASELESKSNAYKARFEETHTELEDARTKLSTIEDRLSETNFGRVEQEDSFDKLKAEHHDLLIIINDLKAENFGFKDTMQSLEKAETLLARQNTELQKQAEILSARITDEHREKEIAVSELKTLRLDYSELKADQMEAMSKLDKALYEVDSSQTALTDFKTRSDDKFFAFNSAIDGLKAQNKIDGDMTRYDNIEKEKFKVEAESERQRADVFKIKLDKKSIEMSENRAALARAKSNYEELNDKFLSLLSEMEGLRHEHKKQSLKLEEYSSISGVAVGQSFYEPRGKKKSSTTTKTKTISTEMPSLKLVKE